MFPRRKGHHMSRHRAHRLWRVARLQLPRRRPHRRVATFRPRPLAATGPNRLWAYDFMFDGSANREQLKCLTVIYEFTWECLAIDVAGSIWSAGVIDVLARLISDRGAPRYLRSDNRQEFVSQAILEWHAKKRIEAAHIEPGKPWQNGDNESFDGTFRDECLSREWYRCRPEARIVIETWSRHYNEVRPQSSHLTPIAFKTRYYSTHPGAFLQSSMVRNSLGRSAPKIQIGPNCNNFPRKIRKFETSELAFRSHVAESKYTLEFSGYSRPARARCRYYSIHLRKRRR